MASHSAELLFNATKDPLKVHVAIKTRFLMRLCLNKF